MIVTVTPNAAVDVTYRVAALVPGASHRVLEVTEGAGGKGINVASVLAGRGIPVLACAVAGGGTGAALRADLDRRGIGHDLVAGHTATRRTITVVSDADGTATVLNEPGRVASRDWAALLGRVGERVADPTAAVVVVSGSLPPGAPDDAGRRLCELARAAGCQVVLDTSGPHLLAALAGLPDVVKPNAEELAEATGGLDPVAGARRLQGAGARHVLVSLGAEGLLLVPPSGPVLRARLGHVVTGNPTGAGDAVVAAVAAGLEAGDPWPAVLREAVAWSAAAVLHPLAGRADEDDIIRLRTAVRVEEARD